MDITAIVMSTNREGDKVPSVPSLNKITMFLWHGYFARNPTKELFSPSLGNIIGFLNPQFLTLGH